MCFLELSSANWTCEEVSRSRGQLLLGISTLVEESGVVEYDLATPCSKRLALSASSCVTLLVPTADEPLLAKPGKYEDIGLADVVLASIKALQRKCRHSSVPKDGTDGNDAGAEGNSSSLSSHCCPRLVRLLFTRCANMTISI